MVWGQCVEFGGAVASHSSTDDMQVLFCKVYLNLSFAVLIAWAGGGLGIWRGGLWCRKLGSSCQP